jgi:hypothetical protein
MEEGGGGGGGGGNKLKCQVNSMCGKLVCLLFIYFFRIPLSITIKSVTISLTTLSIMALGTE